MKRWSSVLLATMIVFALCGCGNKEEAHHFENGVCTGCGDTWAKALYESGASMYGTKSNGYCSFSVPVDGGKVDFSLDERTFLIEYKSNVLNDSQISYCLRTYEKDPGTVVYSDDSVEYTYYGQDSKTSKNAPVSDLNIDYAYMRHFNEAKDEAEYTYFTSYECPADKLMEAYETRSVLTGENAFRFGWYRDFEEYNIYSASELKKLEIVIFGKESPVTSYTLNQRHMLDYKICFMKIDEALEKLGTSLAEYGIEYK